MKKYVMISGIFENNVGDDLMIELLLNRYPDIVFWNSRAAQKKSKKMNVRNYFDFDDLARRFARINHLINLITFNKKKDCFLSWMRKIISRRCCCAISIGGSLYFEWAGTLEQRAWYEESKRLRKKPFFVIGSNFGPYKTQEFLEYFKRYFSECTGVVFRDKYSFNMFSNLPNIKYAPDVVFNIPKGEVHKGNQVLISVIDANRDELRIYEKDYINLIRELCIEIIKNKKKPILVSFCKDEGDEKGVLKIIDTMSKELKEKVDCYYYNGDTEEICYLYRNANAVISTRFHSAILAMRFEKPNFSICYSSKLVEVLNDIKSRNYCKFSETKDFSGKKIYESLEIIPLEDIYLRNANDQFQFFDDFLNNE